MDNIGKIIKGLLAIVLLFAFFHPIATLIFLVSNLGILLAIGIVYVGLRVFLGMSILSFISRSMSDKNEIKKD